MSDLDELGYERLRTVIWLLSGVSRTEENQGDGWARHRESKLRDALERLSRLVSSTYPASSRIIHD